MTTTSNADLEAARDALRGVYDPELGLDIISLGLVYDVRVEDDRIIVEMTLTTPGCPVSESLPDQAAVAVADALGPAGGARVEVHVVWDPPWTPERLSDDAANRLGLRR
jgi:metal-sulfur cluster biosynthetic enzyme